MFLSESDRRRTARQPRILQSHTAVKRHSLHVEKIKMFLFKHTPVQSFSSDLLTVDQRLFPRGHVYGELRKLLQVFEPFSFFQSNFVEARRNETAPGEHKYIWSINNSERDEAGEFNALTSRADEAAGGSRDEEWKGRVLVQRRETRTATSNKNIQTDAAQQKPHASGEQPTSDTSHTERHHQATKLHRSFAYKHLSHSSTWTMKAAVCR